MPAWVLTAAAWLVEFLAPMIRQALTAETRRTETQVAPAVVLEDRPLTPAQQDAAVALERLRRETAERAQERRAARGLPRVAVPVLMAVAVILGGCRTSETITTKVEAVPTLLDTGNQVPDALKVAQRDPILVVPFGPDGETVAGTAPVPIDASGVVLLPPRKVLDLRRAQDALARVVGMLSPEWQIWVARTLNGDVVAEPGQARAADS